MAKGTFGERLKRERELREVPVDELTKATRISRRFLEALENEDWSKLPGGVFGRAFVRTIARYLGLDEESLLAEYDAARGDVSRGVTTDKQEERIPSTPRWIPVAALLALLAVLTGLVYAGRYAWRRYTARHAKQQSSASSAPSNGAVSVSRDAPAAFSPVLLELNSQAMPPLRLRTSSVQWAEPAKLEAGTRWKLSALRSSRICATDAPRVNESLPCAAAARV